jgi:hypothetical protein
MGWFSDNISITASISVLIFCAVYLIIISLIALRK